MNSKNYLAALSVLALVACRGDDATQATGPFEPMRLSLAAHVPAGGEIYRCRYFVMPEDGARDAIRFEHSYTTGSHHILLYPTALSAADVAGDLDDFDCTTRGDLAQTGVAYAADIEPTGEQAFPPDVGMHFEAGDVLLLEAHYLNTTDSDLDAQVDVAMYFADNPVATRAGTLFYYNWSILLPPAPGQASATMRCVIPETIHLQYASSHMHRRGIEFRSHLEGGSLTEPVPLHQTNDWASPIADVYSPAVQVQAGQIIQFTCDYRNDLSRSVTEGESAETDEMCMFIGSYWPQMDLSAENCLVEGSGPVLSGDATCLQTLSCLEETSGAVEEQECLQQTCSASSTALSNFIVCLDEFGCQTDRCIEDHCLEPYFACERASCD